MTFAIPSRKALLGGRGVPSWTPLDLGSSLLAWWDAERSDLITQSGGAVSSWKDVVAGYDLTQALGASRPTYSATSFNGRPGISPDGIDDYLELASGLSWLPAGATPSEDWYAVDQVLAAGLTASLVYGSWGSTNNGNSRLSLRIVSGGVNRASSTVATAATNVNVDFSGRHVLRQVVTATGHKMEIDGDVGSTTALVPATIATRLRMFSNAVASPGSYGRGAMSSRLLTSPLSADQAVQLYTYFNRRL